MNIKDAIRKLKDIVEREKGQLDYMVKGAELLASILAKGENEDGQQQNKSYKQRGESELEKGSKF